MYKTLWRPPTLVFFFAISAPYPIFELCGFGFNTSYNLPSFLFFYTTRSIQMPKAHIQLFGPRRIPVSWAKA